MTEKLEHNIDILLNIIQEIIDDMCEKPVLIPKINEITNIVDCDFEENIDKKSLLELLAKTIEYSLNTHSKYLFNSLSRHPTVNTILATLITTITNNDMYKFETSPVMTIIENIIRIWILEIFNLNEENGDILFNSGGTINNILSISPLLKISIKL